MNHVFGNRPETVLRSRPTKSSGGKHVLMGTWLNVLQIQGDWLFVEKRDRSKQGWVHRQDITETSPLKIFYVDVGQGDGAIVESPQGLILIDGGPNRGYYDYLKKRAQPVVDAGDGPVHIHALVVSHPDDDHFQGFTRLLEDRNFTFGRIYHNGIIRYHRDAGKDLDLGRLRRRTIDGSAVDVLTETYDGIDDVRRLVDREPLMTRFRQFWSAALKARDDGRLRHGCRRVTNRMATLPGFSGQAQDGLRVEVLGPVPTRASGRVELVGFPSPENPQGGPSASHTINGHSIVLKLLFGKYTFLFAGDLNIPAQNYLISRYGATNPFRCDVAKACHHGSSDFTVDYLKKVRPRATVFSSGEARLHDHPLPDALGAATRHSRGNYPLLFSTELARTPIGAGFHYGHINARTNGKQLTMAQKKEKPGLKDPWESFAVPFHGRFRHR